MESIDQRLLKDLASKVATLELQKKTRENYGAGYDWQTPPCYWDCICQNDLVSSVTDWEQEFYPDTTTATITLRVPFRQATAGGELSFPHFNGSNGHGARFARLIVYTEQPVSIPCSAGLVGSSSEAQRKVNGTITTMTGSGDFSFDIDLEVGHNVITFSVNEQTDGFQFRGLLFDGKLTQWVDPNAPMNPTRNGYFTSEGGVGSGGGGELGGTIPAGSE